MSRDYGKQPPQSCARRRRSDCHLLQLDVLLSRGHPAPSRCDDLDERFFQAREAFSAPRFKALTREKGSQTRNHTAAAATATNAIPNELSPVDRVLVFLIAVPVIHLAAALRP